MALAALVRPNRRVLACQQIIGPVLAEQALHLFAWADIPLWAEFRVLVANDVLLGITQYHPDKGYRQISDRAAQFSAALAKAAQFLIGRVRERRFAADLFVDANDRPWLIELNPLGPQTGLGLYSARDFDGGFRYVSKAEGPWDQDDDYWRI
jgi:hypothetical protein